jgi:hypothetical protein
VQNGGIMFTGERYIQFSIVLAANANNPTILNPDFLKYNEIVDRSWDLLNPPICTQPISQIVFNNNVSIVSQLDKVVFSLNLENDESKKFEVIQGISKKYIETIPHVEYIGIGINPRYVIELSSDDTANNFLLNNFIHLNSFSPELLGLGFVIKFSLNEHTTCNLNIDTGKTGGPDKIREAIVVKANFHHVIEPNVTTRIDEMIKVIDSFGDDINYFEKKIIKTLFHKG